MTEEKTCYNCGNPNCHIPLYSVRINVEEHHETYDWDMEFDCMNHDKWEELKVEEIRTDNTETLKNALERIEELTKWLSEKSDECLKLQMLKADLVSQIGNQKKRITELEKENAELQEQIEKMKCCCNCNNFNEERKLCIYSMGDEGYFCRLRQWELRND